MSDTSQGEGWWVASDDKWYPPELHADPEYRSRFEKPEPQAAAAEPQQPAEPKPAEPQPAPVDPKPAEPKPAEPQPAPVDPKPTEPPPYTPPPIAPPTSTTPQMPPAAPLPLTSPDPTTVVPDHVPSGPPATPPPSTERDSSGSGSTSGPWLWITLAVVIVGAAAVAIFALAGGGDDDDEASVTVDQAENATDNNADDPDDTSATESDPEDGDTDTDTENEDADGGGAAGDNDGADDSAADGSDPDGVGTLENPAGFGETYVWDKWQASVVETVDPAQAGLLDEFADPPAAGNVFVAAIYDITYTGSDLTSFLPLAITASGARVYETFACSLDGRALAEQGVDQYTFEAVAGQTVRQAECFEVPESDVDELVFAIQNYEELFGDNEAIFARGGASLPDPPPVDAAPDFESLDLVPFGETSTWPAWSGTVLETRNAEQEGMLSTFSEPARDGFTYVAVVYEVTYTGSSASEYISLTLSGLGSRVYEGFSTCILDTDVTDAEGIETIFEMAPGQTAKLAQCLEIADEDTGSVIFRMTNSTDFESEPVYYSQGG